MDIQAYDERLEMEQKPTESIDNPSRPEIKNVRISYDGKIWHIIVRVRIYLNLD
jgi:hypothetical protein